MGPYLNSGTDNSGMDIFPELRTSFRLSYFDNFFFKRWGFLIQSDLWNKKTNIFS